MLQDYILKRTRSSHLKGFSILQSLRDFQGSESILQTLYDLQRNIQYIFQDSFHTLPLTGFTSWPKKFTQNCLGTAVTRLELFHIYLRFKMHKGSFTFVQHFPRLLQTILGFFRRVQDFFTF